LARPALARQATRSLARRGGSATQLFVVQVRRRRFSVLAWAARQHRIEYRSTRRYAEAKQSEQARKAGRRRPDTIGDNQSDGVGNKAGGYYRPRRLHGRKPVQLLAIEIGGCHRRLRPDWRGCRQRGHEGGFLYETGHRNAPSEDWGTTTLSCILLFRIGFGDLPDTITGR